MISLSLFVLSAAISISSSPGGEPLRLRDLRCRGKPGIDLKIAQNPSPADSRMVRMALRFERATQPVGDNYQNLAPGTCSWNPLNHKEIPAESGVVYFDISPEAQPWFETRTRQMDTTINAAVFFPDTISLPKYLSRTDHYWGFYVDDVTNISISFGARKTDAKLPTYVTLTGPIGKTTPTVAELRCRGGAGISFDGGTRVADNRIRMQMLYRIADREAGPEAGSLAAGTCAWVKRDGMPREAAKIQFETAGNAQIVQARTGGTVDRSPTAAARYPDANTIPVYMENPAHYWNFHVRVAEPTGATSHAAWRAPVGVGERNPADPNQSTMRSQPSSIGDKTPTTAGKTAATANLAKLSFTGVDRTVDGFRVRFTARPNAAATVNYSTSKAISTPSGWYFEGAALQGSGAVSRGGQGAPVTETKRGALFSDYVGATRFAPQRGVNYNFIITAQGSSGPVEQYVGQLKSMQIDVSVMTTTLTVLKKSFDQGVRHDHVLFCETSGRFSPCNGTNVPDRIGIMVYAQPNFGRSDPPPSTWSTVSGKNSGIGRITIDVRNIRPDRVMQPFTITSMPGDVEFEAQGQVQLKRY